MASALPEQPHPLGEMTTAELNAYETELEQMAKTTLEICLYHMVLAKLTEVANERDSRRRIRVVRIWPIF